MDIARIKMHTPAAYEMVTNVLWSMALMVTYTLQLVFTSLQQCYMPYGYMFSNDGSTRKTNSIFEVLDGSDEVTTTTTALYMREQALDECLF